VLCLRDSGEFCGQRIPVSLAAVPSLRHTSLIFMFFCAVNWAVGSLIFSFLLENCPHEFSLTFLKSCSVFFPTSCVRSLESPFVPIAHFLARVAIFWFSQHEGTFTQSLIVLSSVQLELFSFGCKWSLPAFSFEGDD